MPRLSACTLAILAFAFLVILQVNASRDRNKKPYRVVCYLGSWANYYKNNAKFVVEDINPNVCTHLIYGFAKLENNKIAAIDPYLDLKDNGGLGAYSRLNNLRNKNSQLTTLIAIGGWSEGSRKYSDMARDAGKRKTFVNSVLQFLKKHNFDGLDFDWEYPANREGSRPEDKQNFIKLLKELKDAFNPHGFILTAAVGAGKGQVDTAYDVPQMNKYLDFINLMTYDFHGEWDKTTGHNAPLYGNEGDTLNVNYAVNYWLSRGASKNKLVLGMPLYGRCYTLANPSKNGLGQPTTGPGQPGRLLNAAGMVGYHEMADRLKNDNWKSVWADSIKAPYATKGNQWCGYDNERSIQLKSEFAKSKGLGGAMVWSIDTDDFKGLYSNQKFPLLQTINRVLFK